MVMGQDIEPRILGFLCNWCSYAGADLAGVSRFQYPPNITVIRVMCSSRVDPAFILRAFSNGLDGVLVGGCHLGECHYMRGNYEALSMTQLCKKLLAEIGLNPERLRIEWVSAAEGIRFAEIVSHFTEQLRKLGPLSLSEGTDDRVKFKLRAVESLVPYIKLVEREKLRLHSDRESEYEEFFGSDEVNRLFRELISDKLRMSEILLLLRERYLSTGELSEILGLSPSELSGYLDSLARGGFIWFDENQKRFALA